MIFDQKLFCIIFQELNNPDRICSLYSALSKQNPGNEKILRELFFAFVRIKNFQFAQQTAMQLYKVLNRKYKHFFIHFFPFQSTGQTYFYCYAVMCVLMQGYQNKKLGRSMLFPLATKMLQKLQMDDLLQLDGGIFFLHLMEFFYLVFKIEIFFYISNIGIYKKF